MLLRQSKKSGRTRRPLSRSSEGDDSELIRAVDARYTSLMLARLPMLAALLVALSCGSTAPSTSEEAAPAAAPALEWKGETIPLPPSFAPDMALEGVEELRFAPGMYDADSEEYFSYVFVLRFPTTAALDEEQTLGLMRSYYRGLMSAVAESKGSAPALARDTAVSTVSSAGGRLHLQVDTIDAFVTGKPIRLHMKIELRSEGGSSCMRAQVSPSAPEAAIWQRLDTALATLSCQ